MELTVNALAAIVRAGWTVTMCGDFDGGIEYVSPDGNRAVYGDWVRIPDEVAVGIGVAAGK